MNETQLEFEELDNLKADLTLFCYRMLGSIDDADDAVQEVYIRAWQKWSTFRQESSFKTWIYRIATNLCLDKLRKAKHRVFPIDFSDPAVSIIEPSETLPDSSWVWPVPDLQESPEESLIRKDTLQLCFIALLQVLPPRQRAVLILKDVFDWSSKQIADTLAMSPAAVNSALQRARGTMEQADLRSNEFSTMNHEPDEELVSQYVEAFEQFDIDKLVALFHEEGIMSMPPFTMWIQGKQDLSRFFALTRWHCEGSQFIPMTINGGYPAVAQYVTSSDGSTKVPWGIHVIEVKDHKILHLQNFINTKLFIRAGLPEQIHR